jgi:hypothetical protein
VSTHKYGEAALALVAGLLTAYSVTWNTPRFIGFIVIWSGFSFVALLISSVRIASQVESIYRQAALTIDDTPVNSHELEKRLQQVGNTDNKFSLGPVERAEAIRIFAFRKLPVSIMEAGLKSVGMLSVITGLDAKIVARFVADVYRIFGAVTTDDGELLLGVIHQTIRQSAAPPSDFMAAFEHSRRLYCRRPLMHRPTSRNFSLRWTPELHQRRWESISPPACRSDLRK